MKKILFNLVLSTIAVMLAKYFMPGVMLNGWIAAIQLAVVLGLLNAFVKPVLSFFALPLTVITLGLFKLVISAAIVLLADYFLAAFDVGGFVNALIFSILVTIFSYILDVIF